MLIQGDISIGMRDLDVKTLEFLVEICTKCSEISQKGKICGLCLLSYKDWVKIKKYAWKKSGTSIIAIGIQGLVEKDVQNPEWMISTEIQKRKSS